MDISSKLSNLGITVPEGLAKTLDAYTDDQLTTIDGSTDAEELSDAELYEIAEKLLEGTPNTDAKELAQAIFKYIADDTDTDIDTDIDETKETDELEKTYQDKADTLEKFIVTDADGNNTITALPTGFDQLSPAEQAALIEYYKTNDTDETDLYEQAIQAVPTENLDSVIAELYGDDTAFGTTNGEESTNGLNDFLTARFNKTTGRQEDVEAILNPDGAFADMTADQQANLVTGLLTHIKGITNNTDKNTLETAIIGSLKENTDFTGAVNKSFSENSTNKTLHDALNDSEFVAGSLLNAPEQNISFETNLATALSATTPTDTSDKTGKELAKGLMTNIIGDRDEGSVIASDITTSVTDVLKGFVDNENTDGSALNKAKLENFFGEILTNNGGLTNAEYTAVLNGIKASFKVLDENGTDFSNTITGIFNTALEDAQSDTEDGVNTTRLKTNQFMTVEDVQYDENVHLDNETFFVDAGNLDSITTNIDDSEALETQEIDALLAALQDPSIVTEEEDKDNIIEAIITKATNNEYQLQELHKFLQFFPDVLDKLDDAHKDDSENSILGFLTDPYPLTDTDYQTKLNEFKDKSDDFKTILSDAIGITEIDIETETTTTDTDTDTTTTDTDTDTTTTDTDTTTTGTPTTILHIQILKKRLRMPMH
jgi:hypothetical protein